MFREAVWDSAASEIAPLVPGAGSDGRVTFLADGTEGDFFVYRSVGRVRIHQGIPGRKVLSRFKDRHHLGGTI